MQVLAGIRRVRRWSVAVAALLGVAGAPLSVPASAAAAVTSGTFSVLTYNVAGLPLGLSDSDPEVNTPVIGQRVRGYDIVNVQEDFNYHAALYANDDHPHRTATSGGAGIGDGLNTMSRYPFADFVRVDWDACNGTDCLTPKGFTLARVRLAEGVYLDVYNVHTNAGSTDADLAARRANITQLSQYISGNSAGNAVVVMGDTNTRYTRAGDNIRDLTTANGLTDAWVQLVRGGTPPAAGSPALVCDATAPTDACEVVDKILYRGNRFVRLSATRYHNDNAAFLDGAGAPLSDHFPHTVQFSWTLNSALRLSDQFGGPHGTSFTDVPALPAAPQVRSLHLRGGARLDQVGITLTDGATLSHGGTGGTARVLTLGAGEHLTRVRLASGRKDGRTRIFFAEFGTDLGRVLAAGTVTSTTVTYTAPAGWQIVGFHGRAGSEVDKIGLVYAPI
ncbi:jacalin-like lectin [Micromonospora deserti]|uniref:Endonuclease n=1 Tax=Micromonospora deserti TaxID=2070366 RepID=A0A2W2DJ63_9ACTN|nr:jacalin-like lectin [Micromonospora deserti]PZF97256.1 endonuclease [Micromonospora deserti]